MTEEQFEVSDSVWSDVIAIITEGMLSGNDVSNALRGVKLVDGSQATASDEVWHRVVQALQESMLTMTDVFDTLRQVRVTEREGKLYLTEEYKELVKRVHAAMVKDAEHLKAKLDEERGPAPKTFKLTGKSN